ncbi:unnamed protein product [Linum trigynum]|uniref:Uncharacterized protein n=1 Tax=Linum trigynum TaxID=586398 RepID=A0AAV2CPP0_9ROSI
MSSETKTTTSFSKCLRSVVAILFLLVLVQLATLAPDHVEGSRGLRMENRVSYLLLESRLPRGLVPPSGPSPCHNKLGPYQLHRQERSSTVHTDDYIICP